MPPKQKVANARVISEQNYEPLLTISSVVFLTVSLLLPSMISIPITNNCLLNVAEVTLAP